MTYVDGFVAAVPKANKEKYIAHAKAAAVLFKQWGATRVTENWGEDMPKGELNDFYTAVHAKDDEVVVFSWIEYPDKATRDAVQQKMMSDPEMGAMEMPFDGRRMIYAGFANVLDV